MERRGQGHSDLLLGELLLSAARDAGALQAPVVDALLQAVPPGGKVVFVDYHGPHWAHPLKWIMSFVNDTLEPFAKALWVNEIASYASRAEAFSWSKQTYFWGLYQKVVAVRKS